MFTDKPKPFRMYVYFYAKDRYTRNFYALVFFTVKVVALLERSIGDPVDRRGKHERRSKRGEGLNADNTQLVVKGLVTGGIVSTGPHGAPPRRSVISQGLRLPCGSREVVAPAVEPLDLARWRARLILGQMDASDH